MYYLVGTLATIISHAPIITLMRDVNRIDIIGLLKIIIWYRMAIIFSHD